MIDFHTTQPQPVPRVPVVPAMPMADAHWLEAGESRGRRPIAVIGAGFSGTIAALHLLRRLPPDQPVLLCERAGEFARGLAYGIGNAEHLLNVRAANMSALPGQPDHFQAWLAALPAGDQAWVHHTEAGVFATRGLYGRYLRSILDEAMRATANHAQLRLLPDEVLDIEPEAGGYALICAEGRRYAAAGVVLAMGNLRAAETDDARICLDPWGEKGLLPPTGDLPVLIVGTGLTMVDLAVSLRRHGFDGRILALSRGGKLPQAHAATPMWLPPRLTRLEQRSLGALLRRLRAEVRAAAAQGVDWRAVVDSIRPITSELWQALPPAERDRFFRHGRRYWDIHRHRMAPPHARAIETMLHDGSLTVLAGRVRSVRQEGDGLRIRYLPRGEATAADVTVQRMIIASGLEPVRSAGDRLMRRLLERGLIQVDRHGLGLEVGRDLAVVPAEGRAPGPVWALGPLVRGVFWESIAVPDIRIQATELAQNIVVRLRETTPRWDYAG